MFRIFKDDLASRLADALKSARGGADYFEIRLEERAREFLSLDQDGIKRIGSKDRLGGCARACHRGGWGFVAFSGVEGIQKHLRQAIDIARLVGGGATRLAPVDPVKTRVRLELREDPRSVPLEKKLDLFKQYLELLRAGQGDLIRACSVSFTQEFGAKLFQNSEGSDIGQENLSMDLMMHATAFADGCQTPSFDLSNSARDFGFCRGQEKKIEKILANAREFARAASMSGGIYPVILDWDLAGTFAHESFGHTSEADLFASSPGGGEILKLGTRFGSEFLTIYDTGTMREYAGGMAYDDEGVAAGRTDLLKEGILVGRLHDRETAARFSEPATGNARAVDHQYPPIPRMRNTCIAPGPHHFDELLAEIDDGLFACGLHGGHGGENFSFLPARGYRIRKGKIAEPVKNYMLMGNLFESLKDIDGVTGPEDFGTLAAGGENGGCGKMEQFPLPVGMSAPRVRFRKMTVGGA